MLRPTARGASTRLEGYVYSKAGLWFIEPLSRFDPKADADQYLVYATRDLDIAAEVDGVDSAVDEVVDYGGSSDGRIPIVMAADREYRAPGDFRLRQARLINQINGIYAISSSASSRSSHRSPIRPASF